MRLVLIKDDQVVNEFEFGKGPIYIGRHANSQVFLPDRNISRHHAVIFTTIDGQWVAEDLDSPNKTYLNNKPINKAEIKTGDVLKIGNFTIEINLEEDIETADAIYLEDTLQSTALGLEDTMTGEPRELQTIVRRPDIENAPSIKLPAKRSKDFIIAIETICKAGAIEKTLKALLSVVARQFAAYNVWCALRNQISGPMKWNAGKRRDGRSVELDELILGEKIKEAIGSGQFLLFPRIPPQMIVSEKIRSAMIAPISNITGCFGVLYVDNSMNREPYDLSDLDYLMLIAIHTAVILENY
ncbi:MAG: FHA domain-containing protein [Planctomycetes bacterium]|nr:FHA domain-containing protein [Planctomycetota bacterium]